MRELTLTEKESICIAQHIKAYVEQCKNDEQAFFFEPCIDCKLNEDCDFNAYEQFKKMSEVTGVKITPLITKRDAGHQEILSKLDNR